MECGIDLLKPHRGVATRYDQLAVATKPPERGEPPGWRASYRDWCGINDLAHWLELDLTLPG